MNILLWALQVLAALLYGTSGVMKVFLFDKVSKDVPSFGALPREAWMALGILELVCVVGLVVPAALRWQPALTVVAATILAIESLVFIGVHVKYRVRVSHKRGRTASGLGAEFRPDRSLVRSCIVPESAGFGPLTRSG